jgi:Lrp/AsnC family transcriptional regulator for asnA, asnC and gidA
MRQFKPELRIRIYQTNITPFFYRGIRDKWNITVSLSIKIIQPQRTQSNSELSGKNYSILISPMPFLLIIRTVICVINSRISLNPQIWNRLLNIFLLNLRVKIRTGRLNMSGFLLDETDQKILSILVCNARTPFLEIARECGVSGAVVHQRVKKMEDAGIVAGSQFIVKPEILGYNVCAFIGIQLTEPGRYSEVVTQLTHVSEVVECHYVTGDYAVMIKVFCRDNNHLLSTLAGKIHTVPGIEKTYTFLSLDRAFERQVYVKDKNIINQLITVNNE